MYGYTVSDTNLQYTVHVDRYANAVASRTPNTSRTRRHHTQELGTPSVPLAVFARDTLSSPYSNAGVGSKLGRGLCWRIRGVLAHCVDAAIVR